MTFREWLNKKKSTASISCLALKLGLSEFATTKLLNGEMSPKIRDIIRFWVAFRLDSEELMDLINIVADTYQISSLYVFNRVVEEVITLTEQSKDGVVRLERDISL